MDVLSELEILKFPTVLLDMINERVRELDLADHKKKFASVMRDIEDEYRYRRNSRLRSTPANRLFLFKYSNPPLCPLGEEMCRIQRNCYYYETESNKKKVRKMCQFPTWSRDGYAIHHTHDKSVDCIRKQKNYTSDLIGFLTMGIL